MKYNDRDLEKGGKHFFWELKGIITRFNEGGDILSLHMIINC